MGQNRALSLEAPIAIFAVASSFLERDKEYLQTDLGIVLRFETRLPPSMMALWRSSSLKGDFLTPVDSD